MRALRYFAGAYPARTAITLGCLLLAAVVEGIGWSAAVPLLGLAADPAGGSGATSALARAAGEGLARIGLEPRLGVLAWAVVLGFTAKALLLLLARRQVGFTVAHVATDLRVRLVGALLAARWRHVTRQPAGAAANAIATEAERASLSYLHLTQIAQHSFETLLYTGLALAVSWPVTLAACAVGVSGAAALSALVRASGHAGERQTRALEGLLRRLTDGLGALKGLKATGREDDLGPLLTGDTRALERALRGRIFAKEALRALQEPVVVIPGVLGLCFAVTRLGLPLAEAGVLFLLFARTLSGAGKIQRKVQALHAEASALDAMVGRIENATAEREITSGWVEPTLEHGVALEGVRVVLDGRNVLDELSLVLPAGRLTALVGASGSGKTTVADLVTGLVQPDAGRVLVDGVALDGIDLRRWRRMLGYVPQDAVLLHDSVRANVALGNPALADDEIERALREAGAWDFVRALPDGLDASVGERGAHLSGGQRQRLAIARSLAQGARLLILDEATNALDPEGEAAVWETLGKLRGRVTILAISHQPALAGVADRVYRLEDGRATRDDVSDGARRAADRRASRAP